MHDYFVDSRSQIYNKLLTNPNALVNSGWRFCFHSSYEQALVREIREELNTDIKVGNLLKTIEYDYPEFHLTLHCYLCEVVSGNLELLEHESAKWLPAFRLDTVKWLPADKDIINLIKETYA